MAADQERADRIRALKRDHPELTWQAIAERVGVSLRAAQSWQETGGIAYENAKRLASIWGEDVDYIMRGERPATPDLSLADVRGEVRGDVDGVQEQLAEISRKLDRVLAYLGANGEREDASWVGDLSALLGERPAREDEDEQQAG